MGTKITKLQPVGGFAAETGAAVAIFTATQLGVGISTTHTITGAIVGVGATRRLSAVRWGVAGQIVWAWILTIPASATIGAIATCHSRLVRWAGSSVRPQDGARRFVLQVRASATPSTRSSHAERGPRRARQPIERVAQLGGT